MFGDSKDSALFTVDDRERLKAMGDDDEGAVDGEWKTFGEPDGRSDIFRSRAGTADGPGGFAVLGLRSLLSGAPIVIPRDRDVEGGDVR